MWRSAADVLGPEHRSTLGASAETIVQDTMEKLIEKTRRTGISAIPPDVDSIEAFMRRATRNLALNVIRRKKRIAMDPLPEPDEPDGLGEEDDLEAVEDAMIIDSMDAHLGTLTQKELVAYTGYFKEHRTFVDVGAELDVSDTWARKLCSSAVRKLTSAAGIDADRGGDDG